MANGTVQKIHESFSVFDRHLGSFLASIVSAHSEEVRQAAQLASRQLREGHVCVRLSDFAGHVLPAEEGEERPVRLPELNAWVQALRQASCVGRPGEFKPLILDDAQRLYFQRYWRYERDVADFILARRSHSFHANLCPAVVREKLRLFFPEVCADPSFGPALAAALALSGKFLVITGSPGTGKTTAITKILAFLLDLEKRPQRIALCAPTGKAAARLEEAVRKTGETLPCAEDIRKFIPREAMTVHRLLGAIRHSPYFYYGKENPLPYDLVVVDEASMVDLPLAAKLMDALAPDARLFFLGDKDQLASVEAGAVLGSICFSESLNVYSAALKKQLADIGGLLAETSANAPAAAGSIVELTRNYRFSENSSIGALSRSIRQGDAGRVLAILETGRRSDVRFTELSAADDPVSVLSPAVLAFCRAGLEAALEIPARVEDVFARFEAFRLLCALRIGPWGSRNLNAAVERILAGAGLIDLRTPFYEGRPVMIVENDYRLRLFNGDVGIALRDPDTPETIRVFFRDPKKGLRRISPERLPPHETVWAMTVHKSQGSEFDRVALVLAESDAPVLTRELLYTGVTRARTGVEILSPRDVLIRTVLRRISRESGLADALRDPDRNGRGILQ